MYIATYRVLTFSYSILITTAVSNNAIFSFSMLNFDVSNS